MTCKLCLYDRDLRHSHIVPEFNYRPMYDDKHRFMIVTADSTEPIRRQQKGMREYLLCDSCEQLLNRHENYVSRFLFGGVGFTGTTADGKHFIEGIDYRLFRLYHLSVLWRMSVSSLKIFRHVDLGPHAETLRQMILNDDPGDPDLYGFICVAARIDGKLFNDWMVEPSRVKVNGYTIYRVVICGLLYLFFVDGRPVPDPYREGFIKRDGRWMIIEGDVRAIPFLNDWFMAVSEADRKRMS